MEYANIATVGSIAVIAFLAGLAWQKSPLDDKWIPVLCGVLGAVLGVVGMLTMPEYPAANYIDAIAVGILSGLSATGVHQIYKQLWAKEKPDTSLTWEQFQADKGKITFPANEDGTDNGQS